MKTSFKKYGRKDSQDLCEISLENDHGMQVNLLNYGATLEKILLNQENMILTLNGNMEDRSSNCLKMMEKIIFMEVLGLT